MNRRTFLGLSALAPFSTRFVSDASAAAGSTRCLLARERTEAMGQQVHIFCDGGIYEPPKPIQVTLGT